MISKDIYKWKNNIKKQVAQTSLTFDMKMDKLVTTIL